MRQDSTQPLMICPLYQWCFGLLLLLLSNSAFAVYTFSANGSASGAPNCTGNASGIYYCTNGLDNNNEPMTINNTAGPVTIYVTNDMKIRENITVNSSTQLVTFYVSGRLEIQGYGVAANLANSATNVVFFVVGNTTMTFSTVKASIYSTTSGTISAGSTGVVPFVTGSLETTNGSISVYGNVLGCVKSTRGSTNDILLGNNQAVVGGVNCASNGTRSCVNNAGGVPTPSLCKQPTLIARYNLDETSWNGTTNETKDTAGFAGGPFDGQGIGTPKPTALASNPARSGATGTCGSAGFSGSSGGSAFTLDGLPVSSTVGDKTSVSFWMYWDGAAAAKIPISWSKYDLVVDPTDGFGFSTLAADRFGISSTTGLAGNWRHIVAIFTNGNITSNELYIDGVKRTLTQIKGTPNNTNAVVQSTLKVGGSNFVNTVGFDGGRIDEVKVYRDAVSQAQANADFNETHLCPTLNTVPSNFNCVVVGGVANTGRLFTQVAGSPFSVDVVALNASNAVETSYVTSGTKNVTLEFVDGSGTTTCGSRAVLNPSISQTVTFSATDAGRKTVSSINIARAYRDLLCRVTDANQSPSVVGCSTDDFAVRPASFIVSTSNANADSSGASTTASPVIKAGASFNLTATSGVVGYDGTPLIDPARLNAHSGAVQLGVLSGGFGAANATTGISLGNAFNYSEVGYFNLGANGVYDSTFTAVDSASGDCATGFVSSGGRQACSFGNTTATPFFGRFIPDHFEISAGTNIEGCDSGNFTYYGQDGLSTAFAIRAENSLNAMTQNYTGAYAKLGLNTWSNFNFTASPLPVGSTLSASATAPTGVWLNGTANIVARHLVSRPTAATAPTNITLSARPTDSDGVTMPVTAVAASSLFRFGRLFVPNSYGSELLPLSIPIEAQYWNGNAYQRNQQDTCSVVPANTITMSNYRNNLAACETQISGGGTLVAGRTNTTLSRPGAGNNGSVDLTINLNSASGSTCNSATASSAGNANMPWFGNNPNARATFGIFKTPVIYMRENF